MIAPRAPRCRPPRCRPARPAGAPLATVGGVSAVKLVIFDCDGVLVDSEPISNEVLAAVLTECGLPTSTEEALATYKGMIMREVVRTASERLGRALPDDFVERYETVRAEEFRARLQPIPGAAEAVGELTAAGVEVCVATQGKPDKTELTLGLTGLRDLFDADAVYSAYSVPRGKPFPDLFLFAASSRGVTSEEAVVVEDTPIGVRAGVAAGMRVLGFAADSDAAALREAGAEPFGALSELPALLGLPTAD
jgi:HAD superfamily hydrolase (TIGR01509 family)